MPRLPHLLLLLRCALALCAGAAPALAAADTPSRTVVTSDDEWSDDGDWSDEDPGDAWGDWDDECLVADEDGEILVDETCEDDAELCDDWEDWSAEELASEDEWGDDEAWDEWADDDEDLGDEDCGEDAEEAPPTKLTSLRATPARRNAGQVSFRLDRRGAVTLTLRRVRGARASSGPRAMRGAVSVAGRKGANATTLRRWNGRALKPGSYRLTATPAAGRAATTAFTLKIAARRG